ncbi:hypothetical protein CHUAL_002175 [Chamberlinius hualienensis]
MASVAGYNTRWSMAIALVISAFICHTVIADKNKNYYIRNLCGRKRSEQLYKKIDGAVLTSSNENNLDCVITFQTDSVLQKFMLRFEQLQLDCNTNLYIYDGAHPYGDYKAVYSCNNNENDVDLIVTRNTFVTLRYKTDGWVSTGNTFRLVLTAYKDAPLDCRGFRCQNQLCIHEDLKCDRVDHCGDRSDESAAFAYCSDDTVGKVLGVGIWIFVVIIVGSFIACFVCVSGAAMFIYKRYYRRRPPMANLNSTPNYPFLPKVTEESACSAKTNSTALNSHVSVFHSAAPPPPPRPTATIIESRRTPPFGQTATLPRAKPSNVSPMSTSSSPGGIGGERTANRIQCSSGKPILSDDKMKTASLNRSTHKKSGGREKGEWLV